VFGVHDFLSAACTAFPLEDFCCAPGLAGQGVSVAAVISRSKLSSADLLSPAVPRARGAARACRSFSVKDSLAQNCFSPKSKWAGPFSSPAAGPARRRAWSTLPPGLGPPAGRIFWWPSSCSQSRGGLGLGLLYIVNSEI
jgi:hypothetical protein